MTTKATVHYKYDRLYVAITSDDGLARQLWVIAWDERGPYLRAFFTHERRTRRHKFVGVESRCWFHDGALDREPERYLPNGEVRLPTEVLGPLAADVRIEAMGRYR